MLVNIPLDIPDELIDKIIDKTAKEYVATNSRPAIIAHWVIAAGDNYKTDGGYCSNCKCDLPIFMEDWKHVFCKTDFCPNCGAIMEDPEDV